MDVNSVSVRELCEPTRSSMLGLGDSLTKKITEVVEYDVKELESCIENENYRGALEWVSIMSDRLYELEHRIENESPLTHQETFHSTDEYDGTEFGEKLEESEYPVCTVGALALFADVLSAQIDKEFE